MRLSQQSTLGGSRVGSGWCACPSIGDGNQITYSNVYCNGYSTCTSCCSGERPLEKPQGKGPTGGGGGGTPTTSIYRKQSGSDSSGKILGLTTQQALIAVGVGVAAYFIIKKVK